MGNVGIAVCYIFILHALTIRYFIKKKWLQHVQGMDTDYQNKHYNIDRKDEGTWDDQGRGGGTNFILRIKEQDNTPNPSGT